MRYWLKVVFGVVFVLSIIFAKLLGPVHIENTYLKKTYPSLNELQRLVSSSAMTYTLPNVDSEFLSYSKGEFACQDGSKPEVVEYVYYSMGARYDGGWAGMDILDCGTYYFLFEYDSSGLGSVSGPFHDKR